MSVISDMQLEGILNEAEDRKYSETIKDNAGKIKDAGKQVVSNIKNNSWVGKQAQKKEGSKKITFKEDANGNIIDAVLDSEVEELEEKTKFKGKHFELNIGDTSVGFGNYKYYGKKDEINDKKKELVSDLKNTSAVEIEKQKQEWRDEPGAKTGETIGNAITGGNVLNALGKAAGRKVGSTVDSVIKAKNYERKKLKEEADSIANFYRSEEYTRAMNEYFDITDTETRKMLLAVNEADQNKVLVSLTSKLYDNVVDKIDDIDFGEIELTKGDIEKLPNFNTLHECLNNMARLLIEFKQDTKPVDTIAESVSNMIDSKSIWTKAYAVNAELPMVTYNTITLAIIEATSYMVSMCVDFVKSPSQDTMQIMIDKSALTKSKGHMLFKNLEAFNEAYRKGQVEKAMNHVISEAGNKKNFMGLGIYTGFGVGVAVVGIAGILFCIVPLIRELIFLFYYVRVRVSDFFEVQADLLQISAYNVENNRLDLTKEERKQIATKQMKTADKFRQVSRFIGVQMSSAESKAVKDVKSAESKKFKANDVMDELPDSASAALF